jgi:hypothetical protein
MKLTGDRVGHQAGSAQCQVVISPYDPQAHPGPTAASQVPDVPDRRIGIGSAVHEPSAACGRKEVGRRAVLQDDVSEGAAVGHPGVLEDVGGDIGGTCRRPAARRSSRFRIGSACSSVHEMARAARVASTVSFDSQPASMSRAATSGFGYAGEDRARRGRDDNDPGSTSRSINPR